MSRKGVKHGQKVDIELQFPARFTAPSLKIPDSRLDRPNDPKPGLAALSRQFGTRAPLLIDFWLIVILFWSIINLQVSPDSGFKVQMPRFQASLIFHKGPVSQTATAPLWKRWPSEGTTRWSVVCRLSPNRRTIIAKVRPRGEPTVGREAEV